MICGKAIIIQKEWRRYNQQRKYKKILKAVLQIQHAHKGWRSRIDFLRKRRACIVIQSHLRGLFAREVAAALREMRRVEEEMRKRERLEAERREREKEISDQQAEAERIALEECERYVFGSIKNCLNLKLKNEKNNLSIHQELNICNRNWSIFFFWVNLGDLKLFSWVSFPMNVSNLEENRKSTDFSHLFALLQSVVDSGIKSQKPNTFTQHT